MCSDCKTSEDFLAKHGATKIPFGQATLEDDNIYKHANPTWHILNKFKSLIKKRHLSGVGAAAIGAEIHQQFPQYRVSAQSIAKFIKFLQEAGQLSSEIVSAPEKL